MLDRNGPPEGGGMMAHDQMLAVLAASPADHLKELAATILPQMDGIEVVQSRTGLVVLPMRDTVKGTDFHLGEVLVAEAHLRLNGTHQGYGMILGRDLETAMAMAVIDLAVDAGIDSHRIGEFLKDEARAQTERDRDTLRAVEATRVEMETF